MVISLSLCKNNNKDGWMSLNLAANDLMWIFISSLRGKIILVVQL
jgi:hypothetical protein